MLGQTGFGVSDHACWAYRTDGQRAEAASAWLADGLRIGQRGMYVAEATPGQLTAELSTVPEVDRAIGAGALVVASSTELYDLSAPIDPAAQLTRYDAAVRQAVADGYRGLRVAADITPLVLDRSRRAAHCHWEQVADRYMTDHPLAPLCLYDARRVTDIQAIVCSHPLRGPDDSDFSLYATGPRRARFEGEVDELLAPGLRDLHSQLPASDATLDLSGLSFLDARSAATLYTELLSRRAGGQAIELCAAPRAVQRVWDLCGFDRSFLAP